MAKTEAEKLAQIRKLLDTAESLAEQGNTEAAESYREKAIAAMVARGVDEAMLHATRHDSTEVPVKVMIDVPNPYRIDKQGLLAKVANGMGCRAIRLSGTGTICLVGFESDLDRVQVLFTSLLVQAFSELGAQGPAGAQRAPYIKSWLAGFGSVVGQRLVEITERARREYDEAHGSAGTALVLRDRSALVTNAYQEMFPHARKSQRRLSGGGYGHGERAGARADIGATRVGGQRSQIDV